MPSEEPFLGKPETWSNPVVKCFARLDIGVARYLLGKQATNQVFTCLSDLASRFVTEFVEAVPGATKDAFRAVLGFDEGAIPAKASAKASGQAAAAKSLARAKEPAGGAHLPLYDLDSRGVATSGIARLRAKGFDLRATVSIVPRLAGFDEDCVFVIEAVTDSVSLSMLSDPQRKTVVSVGAFLRTASLASSGTIVLMHPAWPRARTAHSQAARQQFAIARAMCALEVLTESVGTSVAELVEIFEKPTKAVKAKRDLAIGELVALPEAAGIKSVGGGAEVPSGAVEVLLDRASGDDGGHRIFFTGSTSSDSVCPYWVFERTLDDREVNMMPVLYRVQLLGGVDVVSDTAEEVVLERAAAQTGAASKASSPAWAGAGKASATGTPGARVVRTMASRDTKEAPHIERFVHIPVLVNFAPVRAGVELKVGKKASVAPPKLAEPVKVNQLAKRAKLM